MGRGLIHKMIHPFSAEEKVEAAEKAGTGRSLSSPGMKLTVQSPASYDEGKKAAELLKAGAGVLLNGEMLDPSTYQRLMDYLDGAVYVLGGASQCVSDKVQIYGPASLEIVDETISVYGIRSLGKRRADA